MGFLGLLLSFLPAGVARFAGSVLGAAGDMLREVVKTRAGWALIGALAGAFVMNIHVSGKWAADVKERTAAGLAARAIEERRQGNVAAVTLEMERIRAEALAESERALAEKVKETPHEAVGDDRPGLSAERVRRIFSIR